MERIDIEPTTSVEDAVKKVLEIAKLINQRAIADFNGFIIDSEFGYDKNIDSYFAYMGRHKNGIDWEQRRYEIAKEMLHDCVEYYDDLNSIINVDVRVESSTELDIKYADALIEKLKREEVQND